MTDRTIYTPEMKQAAVARLNGGENAKAIAKDLKIHASMLYQWRIALAPDTRKRPTAQASSTARHTKKKANGAAGHARAAKGPGRGHYNRRGLRRFDAAFKQRAVARLNAGEDPKKLAKEIGVHNSLIYVWRKAAGFSGRIHAKGGGLALAKGPIAQATDELFASSRARENSQDAITYLRNIRKLKQRLVQEGKGNLDDPIFGLAMLALMSLEGKL